MKNKIVRCLAKYDRQPGDPPDDPMRLAAILAIIISVLVDKQKADIQILLDNLEKQ